MSQCVMKANMANPRLTRPIEWCIALEKNGKPRNGTCNIKSFTVYRNQPPFPATPAIKIMQPEEGDYDSSMVPVMPYYEEKLGQPLGSTSR